MYMYTYLFLIGRVKNNYNINNMTSTNNTKVVTATVIYINSHFRGLGLSCDYYMNFYPELHCDRISMY